MKASKAPSRVALMMAPGLEEIEGLTVADLLYRVSIPCTLISVGEGLQISSSHGIKIVCDQHIDETNFDEFDMIVLPGGIPGTPNLKACDKLMDAIRQFVSDKKTVAAICAAPSILSELGLLRGKKATANPAFIEQLASQGAEVSKDNVVEDGPFITSRGMGTAIDFGLAIVGRILGKDEADKLARTIVYN